jgi:hypothetical protein
MAGNQHTESTWGTIIGWGVLAIFVIWFGWHVGSPLLIGERWADKKSEAIQKVRDSRPLGSDTLYDMIRAYSLRAKEKDRFVGEFNWDAIQREGPEYEVTLLWTEGSERKVAVWRVNLETSDLRPQGNEASGLPQRLASEFPPTS